MVITGSSTVKLCIEGCSRGRLTSSNASLLCFVHASGREKQCWLKYIQLYVLHLYHPDLLSHLEVPTVRDCG